MSFFDKTRYFRALFVLFPLGIFTIYYGYKGLTTTTVDVSFESGKVKNYKLEKLYNTLCECKIRTLVLYLENGKKTYSTTIVEEIEQLHPQLQIGDEVEIWFEVESDGNIIKQVVLNDKLMLQYDRLIGLNLTFLVIGLALVILCLFYLIKSLEDLKGGEKR